MSIPSHAANIASKREAMALLSHALSLERVDLFVGKDVELPCDVGAAVGSVYSHAGTEVVVLVSF